MEYEKSFLVDDVKAPAAFNTRHMTLHCAQCNTVLGDSYGVCGESQCMDAFMCSRVTNDVIISEAMESGRKGELANCIYSFLQCQGCSCAVGKVIHSAPPNLDTHRSLFLLHKADINCYILNSCSMVKASTLTLDLKPLSNTINEVRQLFQAHLDHMSCLKDRLAKRSVNSVLDK